MKRKRPNPAPNSTISKRFRSLPLSHPLCPAVSLLWLQPHSFLSLLSRNILREIASFCPPLQFLAVCDSKLHIYNIEADSYRTVSLFASIPPYCHFFPIDALNVFAFPGTDFRSKERKKLIWVNLKTLEIQPFPPMKAKRRNARVIVAQGTVYVFGGYDNNRFIYDCEKANLQRKQWFSLPSLRSNIPLLNNLSPIYFHNAIYLPDLRGEIDVFDMLQEVFTLLRFKPCAHRCFLAFLLEEEYVILSYNGEEIRLNLSTGEEKYREEKPLKVPVLHPGPFIGRNGNLVYWLVEPRKSLYTFDVTTCKCSAKSLV